MTYAAICGQNICAGWGSHCCHNDINQCCWYRWHEIWWIWFIILMALICICSCVSCCVRKRRARSHGYVVIQSYETQPVYGSLPNQPTQAYDYRVPPPPYTSK